MSIISPKDTAQEKRHHMAQKEAVKKKGICHFVCCVFLVERFLLFMPMRNAWMQGVMRDKEVVGHEEELTHDVGDRRSHTREKEGVGIVYTCTVPVRSDRSSIRYCNRENFLLSNSSSDVSVSNPHPRLMKTCTTRNWRWNVGTVWTKLRSMNLGVPCGDVYQFGVFTGASFRFLAETFRSKEFSSCGDMSSAMPVIYGFDSFEGLPDEKEEEISGARSVWKQGSFNSGDVRKSLKKLVLPMQAVFVKGFFNEALTDDLVGRMRLRQAVYVDIDVDLYGSTKVAMRWLFRNKILGVGSLIGYDDWWADVCAFGDTKIRNSMHAGEGRAHKEIAKEFNVSFECVAGPCMRRPKLEIRACAHWGPIFLVKSIGMKSNTGFTLPDGGCPAEVATLKR